MNAIQNFAFEESLVRAFEIDGDAWFVGTDVCKALGLSNAPQALSRLDPDEKRPDISIDDTSGRKYATIVSEPGVYRLVFTSRKDQAERFKRWLAHDVLPQIRRTGEYRRPGVEALPPSPEDAQSRALRIVTECRLIHGRAAAARLWAELGLPEVPPPLPDDEPEACLAHLLAAALPDGETLGDRLRSALTEGRGDLGGFGVRIGDGVFSVASAHPFILARFRVTRWRQPLQFLRRLPGAEAAKVMKYGGVVSRGTELPAFWVDHSSGSTPAASLPAASTRSSSARI